MNSSLTIAQWQVREQACSSRSSRLDPNEQAHSYGIAESPPSTINSWPVMNDDASLARNKAA